MKRWVYIPTTALLALLLLDRSAPLILNAQEVMAGTAKAPTLYRPLFPYLFTALSSVIDDRDAAWLFWCVTLSFFALFMDEWLRERFSA